MSLVNRGCGRLLMMLQFRITLLKRVKNVRNVSRLAETCKLVREEQLSGSPRLSGYDYFVCLSIPRFLLCLMALFMPHI